jgi:hypothetical protein
VVSILSVGWIGGELAESNFMNEEKRRIFEEQGGEKDPTLRARDIHQLDT